MKDVYTSIDLSRLKSILETAKKLQNEEKKAPGVLKSLIEQYNLISKNIEDSCDLPSIPPFDERYDAGWGYTNLALNGDKKLVDLITYLEGYINAHTPIPPTINHIEGWNKSIVIAVIIGIIGALVTIGVFYANHTYQQGYSSGKAETQKEYDTEKIGLTKELDALKTKCNIITDSLKVCNTNVIAKNDSISFLLSKNEQAKNNKRGSVK